MARIGPVVLIEDVGTQAESRAMPPDWQFVPLRDPLSPAFGMATMMLLAELAAHDPAMRARLAEAGIVR